MAKLTQTKEFKKLVSLGSERGYVTYQEVNRILPEGALDQEKLEKMFEFLKNRHQIDVVDDPAGNKTTEAEQERAALRKPSTQPDRALSETAGEYALLAMPRITAHDVVFRGLHAERQCRHAV